MKLYYVSSKGVKIKVCEPDTIKEGIEKIDGFVKNINPTYVITQKKVTFYEKNVKIDIGSWSEFFYIEEYTQNDVKKYDEKSCIKKYIFITNGMARCGKDTFAAFLSEFIPTTKFSSIDKVKEIAKICGWKGGKTERDRKFLSDLKTLLTEYADMPFKEIEKKVEEFKENNKTNVLLIDIREPNEIQRAKEKFNAKTILIENNRVDVISSNFADANVFNYDYDYVLHNNGTLEEFRLLAKEFAKNLL